MDSYPVVNKSGVPHLHTKGERPEVAAEVGRMVGMYRGVNTQSTKSPMPIFNPAHHDPAPKTQKVDLGKAGSFSVKKGALHRALGVPEGEKIPAKKLAAASHSKDPHVRRMAASAAGLKAMHKGK